MKMRDLSLPTPVTLAAEKIRVRGENISTGKGQKGNLSLSLLLDQRTTFSTRNILSIDPLRVDGSAEIKRLPFRPYSPYYQDRILFQVEDGELEAQTRYHYSKSEKGSEIRLSELSSSLLGLKLQKEGEQEPFLSIPVGFRQRDEPGFEQERSRRSGDLHAEWSHSNPAIQEWRD